MSSPSSIKAIKKDSRVVNLTIFDWDDTLFPTSSFNPRSEEDMRKVYKK